MRREVRTIWQKLGDAILAAFAVLLVAVVVDIVLTFHWTVRQIDLPNGAALYYPWRTVWVIAGIGAVTVILGLRLGMDRQYHNWLLVATGVGFMTLGTSFAARERVVITPEEFTIRRWWGLESHTWQYDDLKSITVVEHHGNRASRWVRVKCEIKEANGDTRTEEVGSPRVLDAIQLKRLDPAREKGVSVTWTLAPR